MVRRSRYDKRDQNEKNIVNMLEAIPGVKVETGHDDILVGYKGCNYWFEIKTPDKFTNSGELKNRNRKTEQKQIDLSQNWPGHYQIVSTLDEILIAIGVLK